MKQTEKKNGAKQALFFLLGAGIAVGAAGITVGVMHKNYDIPAETVDMTEYYHKEAINNLLSTKVDDMDLLKYYTKTEADGLLDKKVDNSTLKFFYDKSTVDNLLSGKVDNARLDEYYRRTEIDRLLNELLSRKVNYDDLNDYYDKATINNLLYQKVDKDTLLDYYTMSQVKALLDGKVDVEELDKYYDKTATDELLGEKADVSELDNYYSKEESDAQLDGKADDADLDNYYDKAESDEKLDGKVDNTELDNYYNKTETDSLISNVLSVQESEENATILEIEVEAGETITFSDTMVGTTSIDWGDGTRNKDKTHTYIEEGRYNVKLYNLVHFGVGEIQESPLYPYSSPLYPYESSKNCSLGTIVGVVDNGQYVYMIQLPSDSKVEVGMHIRFFEGGEDVFLGDGVEVIVTEVHADPNTGTLECAITASGMTEEQFLQYYHPEIVVGLEVRVTSAAYGLKKIIVGQTLETLFRASDACQGIEEIIIPEWMLQEYIGLKLESGLYPYKAFVKTAQNNIYLHDLYFTAATVENTDPDVIGVNKDLWIKGNVYSYCPYELTIREWSIYALCKGISSFDVLNTTIHFKNTEGVEWFATTSANIIFVGSGDYKRGEWCFYFSCEAPFVYATSTGEVGISEGIYIDSTTQTNYGYNDDISTVTKYC